MKSSVKFFLNASKRRMLVLTAVAIVLLVVTATAFMQRGTSIRRAESPVNLDAGRKSQEPATLAPDAITVGTYPFTNFSAIALEDMSSGTAQLVAANQEDTASSVTNIGFDFWFDGVRQTQFSVNANGLLKLGSGAVTTLPTNDLASTVNI